MNQVSPSSISTKLLLWISSIFFILAILAVACLSVFEYKKNVKRIEDSFNQAAKSFEEPLSNALWSLNQDQVELILQGIYGTESVDLVILNSKELGAFEYGNSVLQQGEAFSYELSLSFRGSDLGKLYFFKDKSKVYHEVFLGTLALSILEILFLLILIALTFYIIRTQIIKPIKEVDDFLLSWNLDKINEQDELVLSVVPGKEFKELSQRLNDVKRSLGEAFQEVKESNLKTVEKEKELLRYKDSLEEIVKERTEQLKGALVEAQKANRAKSVFLSNMSHELRTPLNSIILLSKILARKSEEFDKETLKKLKVINSAGNDLLLLIDDILDLTKLELGKIPFSVERFNLLSHVRDIFELYRLNTTGKDINFYFEGEEGDLLVQTDPHRLGQVVKNILGNAIKFTPSGSITVKVEKTDGTPYKAKIQIQDTGPGIPKDKLKFIFNRFAQVNDDSLKSHGGAGLGLFISQMIADNLELKIDVESTVGEGTNFSIYVRDLSIEEKVVEEVKEEVLPKAEGEYTVLIADDNERNLYLLSEILKMDRGLKVKTFTSGLKLIDDLRGDGSEVSLIFLDVMMPDEDGLSVLKTLRSQFSQVPVVMLTASVDEAVELSCLEEGAFGFLRKPIQLPELNKVIDECLYGPSENKGLG